MMRQLTSRPVTLAVGTILVLAGVPGSSGAANREHQQLMADIRMLQEQTQQLQVTLNALAEVMKVVTSRLDDQASGTRKSFADQKVLIDALTGDVRVVREKLDETNVRLSSLSQEVEAVRLVATAPPPMTYLPTPDDTVPEVGPTPPVAAPPAAGLSPQRLYDTAYADFASGQWSLAVQGFETYIRTFPRTEQADDAQLYIGESYALDGKVPEAIAAYDKVIADYPTGDVVPLAYYKRGLAHLRLAQPDLARQSWQIIIEKYPDSDASRLAKQGLDRLARPNR